MRRIVLLALLLCGALSAEAKVKVVESSSKRIPTWYGGAAEEMIIATSQSDISLDDAKRLAMDQIKIKMIESVAQNIKYTALSRVEESIGDVNSFSEEFKSVLLLNSANIPFISGISESKIADYYWEVSEDKSLKSRSYLYAIKYPLPHAQVGAYVREFERVDLERTQELEMLESGFYNVVAVDDIGEAISKCAELESYFFDAIRKGAASSLKARYSSLYGRISVVTKEEELGRAFIALQIGDREVATTQQPSMRYDKSIISDLKVAPRDGGFEILYDPQYCREDIPYIITLSMPVGDRRIDHELTFTKSNMKFRIQPKGTITLTAQSIKSTVIESVQFQLDLQLDGIPANTPIVVDVAIFRVPNLKDELYFNRVSAKYVGDNVVTLLGFAATPIATTGENSASIIKVLSGEIRGYYGAARTPFKINFSRPYNCNW